MRVVWRLIWRIIHTSDSRFFSDALAYICGHPFWSIFHELGWFGHTFSSGSSQSRPNEVASRQRYWTRDSALFSESCDVSGMFGTSAAQVCQRVSIIWLSLPFLFALVGAYFCLVWCASECLRIAILQPQFRPEDVAAMQLNQHASRLWHFLSPGIAAAASFSRRHSCSCGFVRPWME